MLNISRKTVSLAMGATLLAGGLLNSKPAAACSAEPLLASVCIFAGNFAPRGFAFTHGQLLAISQNTALFSLLGTTYGGDGRVTFGLPDTRGRVVMGAGHGPGLSNYILGQRGGTETVTMTTAQMPSHNHSATTAVTAHAVSSAGSTANPDSNSWAATGRDRDYSANAPDVDMAPGVMTATTTVGNTGGSQAHENRMPYLVLNYIIALQGLYPSRN